MTSKTLRRGFAALTLAGAAAIFVAALPVRGQQEQQQTPQESNTPAAPAATEERKPSPLRAVFLALREGREKEAARLLKSIEIQKLDPRDQVRYRQYATSAALRTGDRAWLDKINDDPEKPKLAVDLLLLTAMRFLQNSDYAECRALLERVQNPEALDEVPRRRYLQLYARLEQLTGNAERERAYVAKLVDFAGRWAEPTCQGCHGDYKKFGDAVTSVYLNEWWAGERFGQLLVKDGDAGRVLAAAEAALAKKPDDASARLRVAYLQRATGKAAEAEKTMQALPWVRFPGRDNKAAPQLAPFP